MGAARRRGRYRKGLSVRSELNYAIVQKFREVGIVFAHV